MLKKREFNADFDEIGISREAGLRHRLRDFYEDYAQSIDDNDLEKWADYFTEDCHYRVQSRENYDDGLPLGLIYCMNKNMIRDRVLALRETTVFQPRYVRHFVSGVMIKNIEGDVIESQANFMISECLTDGEPELSMAGQYQDKVVIENGQFRFQYRDCILDNYRVKTSLILPV